MTALDAITPQNEESIYRVLPQIVRIGKEGSVITRDHMVSILIKLAAVPKFREKAFSNLIDQLKICPTNQLPMYAERAAPIANSKNKTLFVRTLASRLDGIDKESKRKRVEKVIKKLS
jgi:hypothetical protein